MKRSLFLFLAPLALAILAPSTARADETVELSNGTTYRGDVIEKVPGDHVTIKLATNEIKTIPWAELKSAPGGHAAGSVQVSVESDKDDTTLYRLAAAGVGVGSAGGQQVIVGFEQYEPMCTAPCRVPADPESTYFVGGGVTGSDKFRLPRQGEVGLKIEGGSIGRRTGGVVLSTFGITGVVTGGAFLLVGALTKPDDSDPYASLTPDHSGTFRTIGFVSLGIGAAMLAGGIALIATSGTKVKTGTGERLAKREIPLGKHFSLTPSGIHF